jgi:hypothetical protein
LFYWGLDDYLTAVILVLSALSIYYSVDITRVSRGAPRGWWFFIAAFVALLVYRATQMYLDIQTPSDIINDYEAGLSLVIGLLLLAGLVMLDRSFRRSLKTVQAG